MKQTYSFLPVIFCSIFISCSSVNKDDSVEGRDSLAIINVDLSEAREGKLSEFFEPEIEYIWLKDDSEDALLSAGLHKIIFDGDKIFTLDVTECQCIKMFDMFGRYISEINANGEGPGQYLEFNDAAIVGGEVLLLGIYPPKQMWFSLDGKFLREEKLSKPIDSGLFSEKGKRYFFFNDTREAGEYFVESISEDFQDTVMSLPFDQNGYYGEFSTRKLFQKTEKSIYFGMPFNDTIYQAKGGNLIPELVFDYGEYRQSINELRKNGKNLNPLEELNFFNKESQLSFVPSQWYISESQLYSGFNYKGKSYNVFFDRKSQLTKVLNSPIKNDLNEGYDPISVLYQFNETKVGNRISGKELFEILQKKKEELGETGFEEYLKTKGKNFAQAAVAAKDSENPVLIVYTVQ